MKDKNTKSRAFAIFSRDDVYAVIIADSLEEAVEIFRGKLIARLDEKSKQSGDMFLPAHLFYGLNPHDDSDGCEVYDGFEWYCQGKPVGIEASHLDFKNNYGLIVKIKKIPIFEKEKNK